MSKGWIIALSIIGGVILFFVLILGWGIGVYNKIVTADESVKSFMGTSGKSISTAV